MMEIDRMNEWALVLTMLGLVIASLGGVFALAKGTGRMQEEIAHLKADNDKQEKDIEALKTRLSHGETRFAVITHQLTGLETTLSDIKRMLLVLTRKSGRQRDAGDADPEGVDVE